MPFHPAVEEWFRETYGGATPAQARTFGPLGRGESTLLLAPTGSGKTLAAFLAVIDRLTFGVEPPAQGRCRVVYVSPLRALAVDIQRNLRGPLAGISATATRRGDPFRAIDVALRTGDTPQAERARMARHPPDILITTPESLFLLANSRARTILRAVEVVIVDEIHSLVPTKRGAHLALTLERLEEMAGRTLQRIGLSATQRPLEEVARFLAGGERSGDHWRPRPVTIIDATGRKAYDLTIEVPLEDLARASRDRPPVASEDVPAGDVKTQRSIWPAIHPRLLELVLSHRSTLLFVNSRRLAERLAGALNDLAGRQVVRAHHGSLAREQRLEIEEALKRGELPGLVATSTLELGIDMGAIDLVVLIETPPSVASAIQRVGRAGHQVEAISRGILFPKFRGDLLSAAALAEGVMAGTVEPSRVPSNPLDVLAQHLVAAVAVSPRSVDDLFALVRRAASYAELPRGQFDGVLDMLSGRYPSEEFGDLRPRITWDRPQGTLSPREGVGRLVAANAGTIPDRGLYGVFLAASEGSGTDERARSPRRVGELDEEMVFESRVGDVFVLGATSWRIAAITRDRVLVHPAPGAPGRMPFWKADRAARPIEQGVAIGRLTRELLAAQRDAATARLVARHGLDPRAAATLLDYLEEQRQATGQVPDDRTMVLERTRDEMGDWRLCLLSPFGGRIHAPLAIALEERLRDDGAETLWSDDGVVIRLPGATRPPDAAALMLDPDDVDSLVARALGGSALFAATFREAAGRALLLSRHRPGQRTPLWIQRKRSADLLAVALRHDSFPILLEAYRECLQDVFDLPALGDLLRRVRRREMRLHTVDTRSPSPFAFSLLFGYVANYLYDGDAPLAERRAQALAVDPQKLRELLGEAELRDLLDPNVIAAVEAELQAAHPERRVRGADRLHDLLLRIGDLALTEIEERTDDGGGDAIASLLTEKRALRVEIAGEARHIAAEDAGRYRDGVGVTLPPWLPGAFTGAAPQALRQIVHRYARHRGPFGSADAARRFGLSVDSVEATLSDLVDDGRLVSGEFRRGARGREWCATDVLDSIRRRSLARLRREVEPQSPEALSRLLVGWQGLAVGVASQQHGGPEALLEVIDQLQGAVVPASTLEQEILPARLPRYSPTDLDLLCGAGEVVWMGAGALGERDGKVALYLAGDLDLLRPQSAEGPAGELLDRLRETLSRRGASFFPDLVAAVGGGLAQPVLDALWDLIWAGEVTNDAPAALRAFLGTGAPGRRGRHPHRPRFRSLRETPASGVGRFSLLAAPTAPPTTARAAALADQLLARHGILTRDAVAREEVPGGFAAIYPVLAALEESGRIRRGYFVAGLGGAQFALPGAIERLRVRPAAGDDAHAVVLAAADPANAFGAALPWPKTEAFRAARLPGVHVVLVDGALVAYLARGGAEVHALLPAEEPRRSRLGRAAAAALSRWAASSGRFGLGWEAESGADAHPLGPYLLEQGFVRWGRGFRLAAV